MKIVISNKRQLKWDAQTSKEFGLDSLEAVAKVLIRYGLSVEDCTIKIQPNGNPEITHSIKLKGYRV